MLSKVDVDSKLRLVGRRDLPVWSVCGRPALTPPRGSSAAAARREIVGSGCGQSPKEDQVQVPAEVRQRPRGL